MAKKKTPSTAQVRRRVREVAHDKLGIEKLRPGQADAVEALLAGHDVLSVMPTGWGKSAIYQIAGAQLPGPTIIVCPLLALQRDQVDSIEQTEIGTVALLNSQLSTTEYRDVLRDFASGETDFLFLAPEQLQNAEVLQNLGVAKPSLFVVDEAHCIASWGHDFRPDYLRLGNAVEQLSRPRVLALTATASPPVQREIVEQLQLHKPKILVQGFNRPNIFLEVRRFESEEAKREALMDDVVGAPKPGIVYTATRKASEELAMELSARGVRAAPYHAGMKRPEREATQSRFMHDEIEVVVATTAFGMGIDKPNVRFVFHLHVSESVDSYYQEIGRSGRDGEPSLARLYYRPADLALRRFFSSGTGVDTTIVKQVMRQLHTTCDGQEPETIAQQASVDARKVRATLQLLTSAGFAHERDGCYVVATNLSIDSVAREIKARTQQHRMFERSRVEMMRGYGELHACRRSYLLNYFGEEFAPPCDTCDYCCRTETVQTEGETSVDDESVGENYPFQLNSRVQHKAWGTGEVLRYESDKIVVLFDTCGYKTLGLTLVQEKQLLQPAEI